MTAVYWILALIFAAACGLAWRFRGSRYGWVALFLVIFAWAGDWLFLGSRSGGFVESLGALSLLFLLILNKGGELTSTDRFTLQLAGGAFAVVVVIYAFLPGLRDLVPILVFALILISLVSFTRRPRKS